jgi:hypothetical protein
MGNPKMKKTRNLTHLLTATATLSSLLLVPSLARAETDFLKVLPQDSIAAVWTGNLSQLQQNTEQSPYGQLWIDPALDPLRQFITEKIKEEQEDTLDAFTEVEKFFEVMKDGLAISISMDPTETDPEEAFHFNLIAELNEESTTWTKEKVAELEKAFVAVTKDTYEVSGVTVYRLKGEMGHSDTEETTISEETVQYAWADKYFIISDSENDVKQTIGALKGNDTVATLGSKEAIKLFNQKAPFTNDGFNFYLNTGDIIQASVNNLNDMDPMIKKNLQRTGLYDLQAVVGSANMAAEGLDFNMAIVTPLEKSGVVKMLKNMEPVNLSTLSMAPANALNVSAFSFSLGDLYDEIIRQFTMFNPQGAAMVQMGIMGMQAQLGTDPINGILKNIEGEHLFIERAFSDEVKQALPPEMAATQNSMAIYLALENGDDTSMNLQTLFDTLKENEMLGSVELSEVNGIKVVKFPPAMMDTGAMVPCMAWNSNFAVLCNNETELQDAIRSLAGGNTSSITADPDLTKALSSIQKDNLYSFTYTPANAIEAGMKQLKSIAEMGYMEEMLGIDADIIPDPAVFSKYLGASWSTTNFDDRMLFMHGYVEKAK